LPIVSCGIVAPIPRQSAIEVCIEEPGFFSSWKKGMPLQDLV
jgi:hypothetical protein